MTDTAFTPGPWVVSVAGNDVLAVTHKPYLSLEQIAAVQKGRSDANLIAAAPDLYAALEAVTRTELMQTLETIVAGWSGPKDAPYARHPSELGAQIPTSCGDVYAAAEVLQQVRAALSKARGEHG